MEYSLWNLPTGFWQAGNQGNTPIESAPRQPYYATPTTAATAVPVFHPNLSDDLSHFTAIANTQPYRQPPDYSPTKNVLGRTVAPLIDDKNQMEGIVTMAGDLLEPRRIDGMPSENLRVNIDPILNERKFKLKRETSPNYSNPCNDSNGQDFLKQGQFQQAMFGMLMNHIPAGKHSDTELDEDEAKSSILVNSGESRSSVNAEEPSPTVGFECGECGYVAEARALLKKHILEAHNEKSASVPSPCPMLACRFKATNRNELEAHVAKHVNEGFGQGGKKKGCPVALQRVRYEREEYRCQLCAYSCTIEKAFYKHLKNHSMGVQPVAIKISCVICGKDRMSENDMTKHMKKHRDDRFFCCDICIFKTVQLKKLIQHRRMHTGEKPHLCPHCSYRSARRDNLRSHVRRVHKKDNLFCDTFKPRGVLVSASGSNQEASPGSSQTE